MLLLSGCHQQPQQHLVQTTVLPVSQAASAPFPSLFLVNIQGLMSSGYSCILVFLIAATLQQVVVGWGWGSCSSLGCRILVRCSDIHSNSTNFITYHCLLHSHFSLLYICLSLGARTFVPVVIYIVHFIYISSLQC